MPGDRSHRSFMISSAQQGKAQHLTGHASARVLTQHTTWQQPGSRRTVLYFYLRDRDLAAAAEQLNQLIVLLRNGTNAFAGMPLKVATDRCYSAGPTAAHRAVKHTISITPIRLQTQGQHELICMAAHWDEKRVCQHAVVSHANIRRNIRQRM